MQTPINIFVIAPSQLPLISTFYKNVHKMRYDGFSILIHDPAPLLEIIKHSTDDFQFRVLVHMEFKGKKIHEFEEAAGWTEMRPLKLAFPNGNFVFFTREVELFPSKGSKEGEFIEYNGYKIFFGTDMTTDSFFKNIPVNTTRDVWSHVLSEPIAFNPLLHTPVSDNMGSSAISREKIDVAVICVVPKEFDALNQLFNFKVSEPCDQIDGLRVWKKEFTQNINQNKVLTMIFTMIGSPGNLSSYLETNALLHRYDISLLILCGIAAGNRDAGTPVYSVALADLVIYYENQKLKPNHEIEYRLNPIPVDGIISKDLVHIQQRLPEWKQQFQDHLKSIRIIKSKDLKGKNWINNKWFDEVKIAIGNILSGEKLLADGIMFDEVVSVTSIRKHTIASEMEGYGFGYACSHNHHHKWLVFRGISDYGNVEKADPINDKYQIIAALAAAALVKDYLLNIYMQPN